MRSPALRHSRYLLCLVGIIATIAVVAGVAADEGQQRNGGPDWIPVDTVPPMVERRALETRARMESRSPSHQRHALRMIRSDIHTYGRAPMRIAATPLIVDLLGMEYRILETPQGYTVDAPTRLLALQVLADLGGEPAREQLRQSLRIDSDESVRASAALLLADVPGSEPDTDYQTVSDALLRATRRDSPEEVMRLLTAAQRLSERAWDPEYPPLLQALVEVSVGGYSSSIRRRAMSFLEDLSAR